MINDLIIQHNYKVPTLLWVTYRIVSYSWSKDSSQLFLLSDGEATFHNIV